MCALHDLSVVSPVVSSQIEQELRPEEEYYDQPPEGTPVDFRQVEQGCTLRFGTFIHRIDQTVTRGIGASQSVRVEEHSAGPLMRLLLGPGTCSLTMESVITWVIAENVETLVEVRRHTLSKVQQYHLKLMCRLRVVAALESCLNCEQDPAEQRRLKQELAALKVKRDKAQRCRETQQQIIKHCERDWSMWGSLNTLPPQREPLRTPQLQLPQKRQQRPPLRPQGRLQECHLLRRIWRWAMLTAPLGRLKMNS